MIKYVICSANDFNRCYCGAETFQEALEKFNYLTEVKRIAVTIRQI